MPYAHQVLEHCNLDVRRVYYPGAGRDHGPFHLFGRLPKKGEQIRDEGWTFSVTSLEGTRLTWITAHRREGGRR